MTYKQFVAWCNARACDGRWGRCAALTCMSVMHDVRSVPFWRREKRWQELNDSLKIVETIVNPINKKIRDMRCGGCVS